MHGGKGRNLGREYSSIGFIDNAAITEQRDHWSGHVDRNIVQYEACSHLLGQSRNVARQVRNAVTQQVHCLVSRRLQSSQGEKNLRWLSANGARR
jgi:hypothetical protein